MSEKPKSFEEFYYKTIGDVCDIEEVIEYSDSHKGKIGYYEGQMFCPECREAELYFVHKTSKRCAHLRRCPTTKHISECSYNYEYASKKHLQEYIDSLTCHEIQDKLNSIINMLFKESRGTEGAEGVLITGIPKDNPMLITVKKEENVIRSLRRKRLNTWIDDADRDKLFVFYGKVKLKVIEKVKMLDGQETYKYYMLEVFNPENKGGWKFRTSFYRGENKDDINEDNIYYIAVIGRVGNKAWQINLANINAVKFVSI